MTSLLSEINIAHFHQYLFYRLLYPTHSPNSFPIIASASFYIIHLKSSHNYSFRILTFYDETTQTCYSYCLESDICIHTQDKLLKSIEGIIWGTVELLTHLNQYKNNDKITLDRQNKFLGLEKIHQMIDRYYLNRLFFPIENLEHSLYYLESPSDFRLESYQCYTLKGQKL
ncbi:MAG: hypothetical protein ACRC0X_09950 [Brevinema sp.]